jgi:Flp pilus assembly protein TadG
MRIARRGRKRARLANFGREQRGSITVEFVIWIPVFLIIMAFMADGCLLYLMQADMWSVARDTARRMTTGQMNATAAHDYAASQMMYPGKHYTINASVIGTDDVVEISIPVKDASVFGVLAAYGSFTDAVLKAKVTMRAES